MPLDRTGLDQRNRMVLSFVRHYHVDAEKQAHERPAPLGAYGMNVVVSHTAGAGPMVRDHLLWDKPFPSPHLADNTVTSFKLPSDIREHMGHPTTLIGLLERAYPKAAEEYKRWEAAAPGTHIPTDVSEDLPRRNRMALSLVRCYDPYKGFAQRPHVLSYAETDAFLESHKIDSGVRAKLLLNAPGGDEPIVGTRVRQKLSLPKEVHAAFDNPPGLEKLLETTYPLAHKEFQKWQEAPDKHFEGEAAYDAAKEGQNSKMSAALHDEKTVAALEATLGAVLGSGHDKSGAILEEFRRRMPRKKGR
jgi:hypothetical protein